MISVRYGEIPHHPFDDLQLLVILLPEIGAIRQRHHEKLVYDRGDTLKMARAQWPAQFSAEIRYRYGRELRGRIHLVLIGSKDHAASRGFELAEVARLVAWIGRKIFLRAKLRRIDEDRRHRHVAMGGRAMNQA